MRLQRHWYWILSLGALLAVILWLPPDLIETFLGKSSQGQSDLISSVYGKSEKISSGDTKYTTLTTSSSLQTGDMIVTYQDSKVLFTFSQSFWLLPFSKMEFLKKDDQWMGRLIYGDLRKSGSPEDLKKPSIQLLYNDQNIETDEFSTAKDTIIATLAPPNSESLQDLDQKEVQPQNLVEKQVYQTLLLHKKFFQSCFIKFYKNNHGQTNDGETVFDLLIDVNGTIESATVTRTDIADQEYIQCLKMVFARMRFKNFQTHSAFHAIFPLRVDLPQTH